MWTVNNLLANKKPSFQRLQDFGFVKNDDGYLYSTQIVNDFELQILVDINSVLTVKVIDSSIDEEYTLLHSQDAVGAFVGEVRDAVEKVVYQIVNCCYDVSLHSVQGEILINEISKIYGICPEYLWEDTPWCAIFRNKKNQRWFAVFQTVEKRKLGIDQDGKVEIINVKASPETITELVDGKSYFPGFHMNKKHWLTICLDGSVSLEAILSHANKSFTLVN